MPAPEKVKLPPRKKHNNSAFNWRCLTLGITIGIISTWLIMSDIIPLKKLFTASDSKPVSGRQKPQEDHDIVDNLPIEFYKLLPSREERIPDHIISEQVREHSPETPMDKPGKYRLQAGSFQKLTDADNRRASILILGLDTHIEKVIHGGRTWHRVILGPFQSLKQLEAARRLLGKNNIDTIVVRTR